VPDLAFEGRCKCDVGFANYLDSDGFADQTRPRHYCVVDTACNSVGTFKPLREDQWHSYFSGTATPNAPLEGDFGVCECEVDYGGVSCQFSAESTCCRDQGVAKCRDFTQFSNVIGDCDDCANPDPRNEGASNSFDDAASWHMCCFWEGDVRREDASSNEKFYLSCLVLILIIEVCGGAWLLSQDVDVGVKQVIIVLVFGTFNPFVHAQTPHASALCAPLQPQVSAPMRPSCTLADTRCVHAAVTHTVWRQRQRQQLVKYKSRVD